MPYYLTPEQDDFNKIPEIQVCIARSLVRCGFDCGGPRGLPKRRTRGLTQPDLV